MRVALDTNILAYAEGVDGDSMQRRSLAIIEKLDTEQTILPAQALGELFNVLVKKALFARSDAKTSVLAWYDAYIVADTSAPVIEAATELAAGHGLNIWDSVVIAASASVGCRLLLSEDMHEGFSWRGLTIVNPFAAVLHPQLQAVLAKHI